MTKISVLEQKTFEGKPSGFKVTLDDGRSGNLQEKESDKGLRLGDEVIVKEIPYTSKAGKTSTLYGLRLNQGAPVQQPPQTATSQSATPTPRPSIHVGSGKSKEELKAEAAIRIAEECIRAYYGGKLESAQISVDQAEFAKLLWSEIDEIFSSK
jgi:hypothetical protein